MNVEKFEEFNRGVNGNFKSTEYHKKRALKIFYELHSMTPSELIKEGREEPEEDSEKSWLEENLAIYL